MRIKALQNRVKSVFDEYKNQKGQKSPFFSAQVNGDEADLYVYDAIGGWWGVTAADVIEQLAGISAGKINVRIHSPGGDVIEGAAIMTALANKKAEIVTYNDGLAASMGSGLIMSGHKRVMSEGAWMMIHEPWTMAMGNAGEFRELADFLDKHTLNLAKSYSKRTAPDGLTHDEVVSAMAAETWYTAEEALDAGLIDEIVETVPVNDAWHGAGLLNLCENVPDGISDLISASNDYRIKTVRDFERFLRNEGGFTANQAKIITSEGYTPELRDEAGNQGGELRDEADILDQLGSQLDELYLQMRM